MVPAGMAIVAPTGAVLMRVRSCPGAPVSPRSVTDVLAGPVPGLRRLPDNETNFVQSDCGVMASVIILAASDPLNVPLPEVFPLSHLKLIEVKVPLN